jgi:hypothetical protein
LIGLTKPNNQPEPTTKKACKRIPFTAILAAIIIAAPTGA